MIYGIIYIAGVVGIGTYLTFVKSIAVYRQKYDLQVKKVPKIWNWTNDGLTATDPNEWLGVSLIAFSWPLHLPGAAIAYVWTKIIRKVALSREEKACIALGVKPQMEIEREKEKKKNEDLYAKQMQQMGAARPQRITTTVNSLSEKDAQTIAEKLHEVGMETYASKYYTEGNDE